MSIFDGILGQGGVSPDIANLAEKVGLSPETTEQVIAALGAAHQQSGDTVELSSAQTGVDTGTVGKIVEHIGGEGSLGAFADMVATNPEAQGLLGKLGIGGVAKGLFGRE